MRVLFYGYVMVIALGLVAFLVIGAGRW